MNGDLAVSKRTGSFLRDDAVKIYTLHSVNEYFAQVGKRVLVPFLLPQVLRSSRQIQFATWTRNVHTQIRIVVDTFKVHYFRAVYAAKRLDHCTSSEAATMHSGCASSCQTPDP